MKSLCGAGLVLALFIATANAQVTPVKGIDVYNSVAVNTHMTYGAPYAYLPNFSTLVTKLQQAHITHIRDSEWGNCANVQPWVTSMWTQLNVAGIKTDLILCGDNMSLTLPQYENDLKGYPGVESIEAMNEWDYNGGPTWENTLAQMMPIIHQAGVDLNLPVIGPSFVSSQAFSQAGDLSQYVDFGNVHDYQGNRNPETLGWGGGVDAQGNGYGSILWNIDMAHEYAPAKPVIATETGIQSTLTAASGKVPESVQGTYAPRVYLAAFKRGVPRTYYYELVDTPYSDTYGLLHLDLTPKPAWTAVTNLLTTLSDVSGTFTPAPLAYSLTGSTAGLETLLVQKSGGMYWLYAWLDASIWDVTKGVATPVPTQPVRLTLSNGMVVTYSAQFNADGSVTKAWPQASSYSFNASSNVTALRIYWKNQ